MRSRTAIGRMVEVDAGVVHVRMDGPAGPPDPSGAEPAGPPGPHHVPDIVLLHGYSSSLHAFDGIVPVLARQHRVVRLDLLGHGGTRARTPDFGSARQADMVDQVLDRLGVTGVVVVGHSYGADVAIAVAERRPQARVVVVAQAPDYADARLPRGSALLSRPAVGRALRRLSTTPAVNRSARFAFARHTRPGWLVDRADRLTQDFRATDPAVDHAVLVDRPRQLAERGLDQRLAALGRPALVILGARDRLYPAEATRRRYAAVPGVQVVVLADSGHSPPLEQPWRTAELVRAFATP